MELNDGQIKRVEALHKVLSAGCTVGDQYGPGILLENLTAPTLSHNPIWPDMDLSPGKAHPDPFSAWRRDINVCGYLNFVLECDQKDISLEEQLERLQALSPYTRMRIYSGGKSYHNWISVADTLPYDPSTPQGVAQFKAAFMGLKAWAETLTGLKFDDKFQNPSQPARTPWVIRPETGKMQEVIFEGPLVTADFIQSVSLPIKIPSKGGYKLPVNESLDLAKFEWMLSNEFVCKPLRNKFGRAREWGKPENLYPTLLRYTLWAIDTTGVPQSTFAAYFHKHVSPALVSCGYPFHKIELAIELAYKFKSTKRGATYGRV